MICPGCGTSTYNKRKHNARWDKLWSSYCGTEDPLPQKKLFGYGYMNEKANKNN